jgi:ATP-dependent DNA helicase RecQ
MSPGRQIGWQHSGRVVRVGRGGFEGLRAWRAAAKDWGWPAYVVVHDATPRRPASDTPSSLAELATVSGVGEAKLARYGQQILDVLSPE